MTAFLGRARAKKGMFEGNIEDGELEIGQIVGMINDVKSVKEIVFEIVSEFNHSKLDIGNL